MKNYDLEERTLKFSLEVLDVAKKIEKKETNKPLINQLIRAGTSIGANYREANGASSKKDFKNKIHICKKEAKETAYWLMLLRSNEEENNEALTRLENEAQQLVLIFGKIASTTANGLN